MFSSLCEVRNCSYSTSFLNCLRLHCNTFAIPYLPVGVNAMLSLLLSRCFFEDDDFDDDFEDEDFEEMYIKLPLNKILHFMLLKDARRHE